MVGGAVLARLRRQREPDWPDAKERHVRLRVIVWTFGRAHYEPALELDELD